MMKNARFLTKMHGLIAHQNDEKCAIFDKNAWTIAHQNDEKCAIFQEKMVVL